MTDIFTISEAQNIYTTKNALTSIINNNNALRDPLDRGIADVVIAGGFFASSLNMESHNDIDVFILNNNVSKYSYLTYVNEPDPSGAVWTITHGKHYMNSNPHVLGVTTNKDTKVQYILTDFKDRKELLADFDFVHCTTSYVPADDKLYITRESYDCIVKKELRNNKKEEPADWRIDKFMSRGWKFNLYDAPMIEVKSDVDTILDDILKRHGIPGAVLAYQNR